MDINKLRKQAQSVFDAYPDLQELIATEDSNFFTPANKQHAMNHAKTKNIKWITITRNEKKLLAKDENPIAEMTIKEVIEWAENQNELTMLQEALEKVETKGGKAAIENRIKILTKEA